jgi:N-acetylglucosamine-6-sulfatase
MRHVVRAGVTVMVACLLALSAFAGTSGSPAGATTPVAAAPATDTNFVLVTADDMRADDLRYMPHTRRLLARQGTTFSQGLSNYPLCCPARASLVSGQYSHNNGVKGNEYPYGGHRVWYESGGDAYALPVRLKGAGYQTSFIGKYLNYYGQISGDQYGGGRDYIPPGWDDWNGIVGNAFKYYCNRLNQNGTIRNYFWQYQTDLLTDIGRSSIRRMSGSEEPFFMWLSYVAPHGGFTPTDEGPCTTQPGFDVPPAPRHVDMFPGLPLPPSPALNEADLTDKGTFMQDDVRKPVDVSAEQKTHRARIASLQSLDEGVRGLVAELRNRGVLDRTVIVFTSDNGYFLGEHRLRGKVLPYEEALRVPLVVRGPGFPAGATRDQPAGLVDITATATEIAHAPEDPEHPLDGVSLRPLAQDAEYLADRVMPIEAGPQPWLQKSYDPEPEWLYQGVRTAQHTYVAWHVGEEREEELYDLALDPFQLESAHEPPSPDLTKLRTLAESLGSCVGSECVATLGQSVTPARSMDPEGVAPVVDVVSAPKGWIRATRPRITYSVEDPDGPAADVSTWCSHQALDCGSGTSRLRLTTEGWQEWRILATDADLNVGARTGHVALDLYRPKALRRSPKYAVVDGRFATGWRVSDSGSGVRVVHARIRRGGPTGTFGSWQRPDHLQGRRQARERLTAPVRGRTVCAQLLARDRVGRRTTWTGDLCRARPVDPGLMTRRGTWRSVDRARWWNGTAHATPQQGASLTLPTSGALGVVTVTARTGPRQGAFTVSIGDRVVRRIDLAQRSGGRHTYRVRPGSRRGPVTVTVVSDGKPVWVDSVGAVRRPVAW